MDKIRRSLNKDKSPGSPPAGYRYNSATSPPMPQQSASFQPIARAPGNQPPIKVIRAIQGYRARSLIELSFEKGDFFHVVGEREQDGMFEASNPSTGASGLVPMDCFQILGRSERSSQAAVPQTSGHRNAGPAPSTAAGGTPVVAPTKRTSGSKPGTLYGVVQYNFVAERGDELDAKRGDNIIIIAQSNHEWFVAKPIGRLGGPGLIPVSYVQIQNMATGKALDPTLVQEIIKSGTLPGVEEWKKSTAEYKQSSIPLGRFDFAGAPQPNGASAKGQPLAIEAGSAAAGDRATQRSTGSSGAMRQVASHHESSGSRLDAQYPPKHQSHSSPALGERSSYSAENANRFSSSNKSASASHQSASMGGSDEADAERYGVVTQAAVVTFHYEEGSYWFHLKVWFDSGAELMLYRLYDDFHTYFYDLVKALPVEAGTKAPPGAHPDDKQRIIPMMPGPVNVVDEFVCMDRVEGLTSFLQELMNMPRHILVHPLTYDFFLLRPGDVEVSKPGRRSMANGSNHSDRAEGELVEQLRRMPGGVSARSSVDPQRASNDYGRLSVNGKKSYEGLRGNTPSPAPTHGSNAGSGAPQPSFLKIKIFQRTTDDLIAIRVPPDVSLDQLIDKAGERLGTDVRTLKWREELPGIGKGGGHLVELTSTSAFDRWVKSGAKLVLYAD